MYFTKPNAEIAELDLLVCQPGTFTVNTVLQLSLMSTQSNWLVLQAWLEVERGLDWSFNKLIP